MSDLRQYNVHINGIATVLNLTDADAVARGLDESALVEAPDLDVSPEDGDAADLDVSSEVDDDAADLGDAAEPPNGGGQKAARPANKARRVADKAAPDPVGL